MRLIARKYGTISARTFVQATSFNHLASNPPTTMLKRWPNRLQHLRQKERLYKSCPVKKAASWLCAYTPTDHTTDLVYTCTGSIRALIDTTQDTI